MKLLALADLVLQVKRWGVKSCDLPLGIKFLQHPHSCFLGSIHFMGIPTRGRTRASSYFFLLLLGVWPLEQNDKLP